MVDTTNFRQDTSNHGTSDQLHVVEWFSPVDKTTLRYRVTVEDPQTWVRPWTAEWLFHATADAMLEVSCHENDYDMENYLRATRYFHENPGNLPHILQSAAAGAHKLS